MIFWKLINNTIQPVCETNRLGFPINEYILSDEYINNITEIPIFITCHAFGDWAIMSAFPRLIKEKYPDKKILIPSEFLNII